MTEAETPEQKAERTREARLAGLEKARAARRAKKQARESEQEAVPGEATPAAVLKTSSAELRALAARPLAAPPEPEPEDDDAEEDDPEDPRSTRPRSIDDLMAKLPPMEQLPGPREVARSLQIDTGGSGPLPPPDMNPNHNRGILESAEIPDISDRTPRSLEDLMTTAAHWAIGQWYVSVERKSPSHFNQIQCRGMQREIRQYMSLLDFTNAYGGGSYLLILYGPPRGGSMFDRNTGKQRYVRYSKPVRVDISQDTYPPNVDSTLLDDGDYDSPDEDPMRQYQGFRSQVSTPADATIHEANLKHEDRREERWEKREEKLRREMAQQQAGLPEVLRLQHESLREEREAAQRLIESERQERERERQRLERKIEEERSRPTDFQAIANMLGSLMSNQGKDGASKETINEMRRQLDTLRDHHAAEVQRLNEKHTAELTALRADFDRQREREERQHKDDLERVERRVADAEQRADKRVADAEQRAERELREVRDRADREMRTEKEISKSRYDDLDRSWKQRCDDLERQHQRDLNMKDQTFEVRLSGTKDSYENRISMLAAEQTRQQAELDRVRAEAEAGKDIVGQISKFKETAGALGFSDGHAPEEELPQDWKGMIAYLGKHFFQNMPEVISQAGQTVGQLRSAQVSPAQAQAMQEAERHRMLAQASAPQGVGALRGRDGMPFAPTRQLAFGLEDFDLGDNSHIAPAEPRSYPLPQEPGRPHAPVQPTPPSAIVPVAPVQQAPVYAAPQPQPQPAPPPQPPAPQAAAPAQPEEEEAIQLPDNALLELEPGLSQAFKQNATPADVAKDILAKLGPQVGQMIAGGLDPDEVAARLMALGRPTSPFVRPAGKKWLGDLLDAMYEQLGMSE